MKTTTTIWAIEWRVESNKKLHTSKHWANIYTNKENAINIAKATIENDDENNHYFRTAQVIEITADQFGSLEKVIARFSNL